MIADAAGVVPTYRRHMATTRSDAPAAPPAAAPAPSIQSGDGRAHDVLVVSDVQKSFKHGIWPERKKTDVLKGVDLTVHSGELVGLVGENGSGKSTLMKIIVGLLDRDTGTVERSGKLGYCPQLPLLWDKLTVAEHFELYARAYDLTPERAGPAIERLLDELQFARYRDYRIEDLSGGTRQKVNLTISLMHEPELLLLDEPYTGFDWETYMRFWELSESRRQRGMAILIVSHMITENKRLDRVLNLRDGRIVD